MHTHTLDNGLLVVSERMEARSVAIGLWVGTGACHEVDGESGMSHFIEHMLFKGTQKRCAKDIAAEMDGVGGQLNAFTGKECTCFHAKVMDAHLPIAGDLLADMLLHSRFDPGEIRKEQGVVVEEIAMVQDSPEDLVHDMAAELYYGDGPMGNNILGSRESVMAFEAEGLRAYMGKQYVPGNAVLSLAGNVSDGQAVELAEQCFGEWAAAERPSAQGLNAVRGKEKVRCCARDAEQVHLCLVMPGVSLKEEAQYPMLVLNNLLGGSMSSRLFQQVREERGLAYSIYSYPSAAVESGAFSVYAGCSPAQAEQVTKLVLEELAEIRQNGVTEEEFVRGREQLRGSFILGREGVASRMNVMGKGMLQLGRVQTEEEVLAKIDAVTPEDVVQLARRIFDPAGIRGAYAGATKGLRPENWL